MGIMEGKVCVVTGGGGSIGMAAAQALLDEGARVLLVGRTPEKLTWAATALTAKADMLDSIAADVSDAADTRKYLNQAVANWGSIDVIFSHAGISGVIKPVTEYPEDVFDAETDAPIAKPRPAAQAGPLPEDIDRLAEMLAAAERPLIWVGTAVRPAEVADVTKLV